MFFCSYKAFIIFSFYISSITGYSCNKRKYPDGIACVCNETFCDTLDDVDLNGRNSFVLVSTSKAGLRFNVKKGHISMIPNQLIVGNQLKKQFESICYNCNARRSASIFIEDNGTIEVTIKLNQQQCYQKIIGFGGAFTGSVSYLLKLISKNVQSHIYKSYYCNSSGIGYKFMRIPIGGSDFDLEPWAYNIHPFNDIKLSNFTQLDERDLDRISQIKELQKAANNPQIKFVGAAWSSPPWMKTKPEWSGRDFLKPEFYQTWADYHLRYLQLMSKEGINFWAISTGNEPFNAVIAWLFILFLDLGWTAEDQGKWVGQNLGPLLKNSNVSHVKILGLDDQRYQLAWWFQDMDRSFPNSTDYLDGIAVHWYRDKMVPVTFLDFVHEKYPEKFIINTESSIIGSPKLGSWVRAERYIEGFIEDFKHWVAGWIDWNLVVDLIGGPNYVRNFVDAPIILNATANEFYKQPIFYAIGHFSRFLTPDSVRIETSTSHNNVLTVAAKRPDGTISLIFYNKANQPANVTIEDGSKKLFEILVPPKSIHTLVYEISN